jgi:hypothetical protein
MIGKPDKPDDRVEQVCVYGVDAYRLDAGVAFPGRGSGLHHDRGDEGWVEVKPQAEVRPCIRRLLHLEDYGKVYREEEVLPRVV